MKEEDVFLEFLQNFGDADKDGTISKEVFEIFPKIINRQLIPKIPLKGVGFLLCRSQLIYR